MIHAPRSVYVAFDVFPRPKGSSSHMAFMLGSLAEERGPVWLLCLGHGDMPSVQIEGNIVIHRFKLYHPHILKRAVAFAGFVTSTLSGAGASVEYLLFRDPWGGCPALRTGLGRVRVFEVNALPSVELPYLYPALRGNVSLLEKIRDQERTCLRQAHGIIAVSSVTRDRLLGLGVRRDKITVLPNAASEIFFSGDSLPCPFPELAQGTWFGYIGSLHSWQGVETALQAFAMTASDIPETRMLLVTGERGASLKALRRRIRRLGISDRVLIRPPVPPEQLAAVMAALRFTVAPLEETTRNTSQGCCPVKIIESMAAGTAVIASDLGPCRDLISHGRDGVLVPAGEPRRWAAALRRMCRDEDFARGLSENARRRAERSFHHRRIRGRLDAWLTALETQTGESDSDGMEETALRL